MVTLSVLSSNPMLSNTASFGELGRLFDDTAAYVGQLFDARLAFEPADVGLLPFFLTDRYRLAETTLFGRRLLILATLGQDAETPAAIAKHVATARSTSDGFVVVVLTDALSSANRQRLIQQGVNFIVPGNQLFLPELGADLREYFRSEVRPALEQLTPAAQVLVVATLLQEDLDGQTPKSLAERFQYSAMTTGRVVDELQRHGILDVEARGRERRIAFSEEGDALWRDVRPLLQSPVRARRLVRPFPEVRTLPLAGESALADYTNLGPPPLDIRAVSARQWKALVYQYDLEPADDDDPAAVRIETWSYDPRLLCHHGPVVDRISLFLSLEDRHDERLEQAVETLMESLGWS